MRYPLPTARHSGVISKSSDVAGFTLTRTEYEPNLWLSEHAHERACFCFVLRGNYVETYSRTALTCQTSSLLFRPPAEPHSDRFQGAGALCFIIEFGSAWLDLICRHHAAAFRRPTASCGSSAAWLALKLHQEFDHPDEVSPLAVQGLTLAIAAEMSREPVKFADGNPPHWLRRAKEILHAHFAENLSHADIAERVGVHPVYLAAAFRKCYGCTIGDYVRRLRVEYACRAVLDSDAPLAEIAFAAGFSSQSHFSRLFKRHTGLTPAQCRAFARRS